MCLTVMLLHRLICVEKQLIPAWTREVGFFFVLFLFFFFFFGIQNKHFQKAILCSESNA
jgi:hypothetical protein